MACPPDTVAGLGRLGETHRSGTSHRVCFMSERHFALAGLGFGGIGQGVRKRTSLLVPQLAPAWSTGARGGWHERTVHVSARQFNLQTISCSIGDYVLIPKDLTKSAKSNHRLD